MALIKDHIIHSIRNHLGLPKNRSFELVESVLEIIKKALESVEDVLISGFGKFSVKEKNERKGSNPVTGEDLMLGARRTVTFKCAAKWRDKISGKG